jgi:hypothetical protein
MSFAEFQRRHITTDTSDAKSAAWQAFGSFLQEVIDSILVPSALDAARTLASLPLSSAATVNTREAIRNARGESIDHGIEGVTESLVTLSFGLPPTMTPDGREAHFRSRVHLVIICRPLQLSLFIYRFDLASGTYALEAEVPLAEITKQAIERELTKAIGFAIALWQAQHEQAPVVFR